jgi:DNA-binding transcriptional LysR family regulator
MTEAQLRAFVTVAETGSFADAARQLHMTQSGVSRAVATLENELGGVLLHRGPGRTRLTALGEPALTRSRTILRETAEMRQGIDGVARGRVRLGSMPSVSATLLPPLLSRLEQRHPAVEVAIVDGHDDELVDWVRDGIVDIAVVAGEHTGLEQQLLFRDEFLAVLPRTHPLAAAPTVSRAAFADLPFILTRAGCERRVLELLASSGIRPSVAHEVSEPSAILAMVSEGIGVSIMPSLAARRPPRSVVLLPLDPPAERRLSLATLTGASPSPAVDAFRAEVVERGGRSRSNPGDDTMTHA